LAALIPAIAAAQSGWHKAGSHPADYDMGSDAIAFTGGSSGFIRANKPMPGGFGTYMQTIDAAEYRGKRLRLSAYVKSDSVGSWAGLWMRVDDATKPIAFDNMQDRAIKGTQNWTQHSIVLDVGANATAVAFGILLSGGGAVWIDDVTFETVGQDVPVTDTMLRTGPQNLDFENPPAKR
jgi:hypothetical protein